MEVCWYEAPRGHTYDGLIDPVDAPHTIRIIARPSMKTFFPLFVDILKAVGSHKDMPTRGKSAATPLTLATAWSFANRIHSVYLGESQDLSPAALEEAIDFAHRIGADLHLIFAIGTVHLHGPTLERRGARLRAFSELPRWLREPVAPLPTSSDDAHAVHVPEYVPDDEWITFRSAYRQVFEPEEVDACDHIYAEAMKAARAAIPNTPDQVARIVASVWLNHRCREHRRLVAVRAIQAALFMDGWNVRAEMNHLSRYVTDRYLNPLLPNEYEALAGYADTWRSAAVVLHAHHIPVARMRETRAREVGHDGSFPSVEISDATARRILLAQRWTQLIGEPDPDPAFISRTELTVRSGIRQVVRDLNLPLVPRWRRSDDRRYDQRTGIAMERIS